MADHDFNSFCCYFWFWDGSTWILLGKSLSNLKFKYGWLYFLTVYVIIFEFEVGVPGCYLVNLCQISSLSMADHVFYSFCCYFWFWGGSTWVLSGKSFSNLKFKYGWSYFLTVFVVILDLEVGVFGFYQVNLHLFSSLSMADHVFLTVYVIIFYFEVGVPGFYLVNLPQFSSLSMADHVFHQFMSFLILRLEYLGFIR